MAEAASATPAGMIAEAALAVAGHDDQAAIGNTPLNAACNLSELTATAATAPTNLGLGPAAVSAAALVGDPG